MSRLVCLGGPPCSGKSSVGTKLAAQLGWPHLEMDSIRQRLLPDAKHTRQDRMVAYRAMHWAAKLLLELGHDVICNATYQHGEDRLAVAELVGGVPGAHLYVVQFQVEEDAAVQRNSLRTAHAALDLDEARVRHLVRSYPWYQKGLMIAANLSIEEGVRSVCEFVTDPEKSTVPADWGRSGLFGLE